MSGQEEVAQTGGNEVAEEGEKEVAQGGEEEDEKTKAEREQKLEAAREAVQKKRTSEIDDDTCFEKCFVKAKALQQTVAQLEMDEEILEELNDDKAMDDWGKAKFGVDNFGKKFGNVITVFVLLNALTIGIETDFAGKYPAVRAAMNVLEHIYCTVFLIEMIIRITVDHVEYFTTPMSLIDCVLVNFAVFDTWILPLAVGSGVGIGQLSILRVIRLLRLVRLIKLMRAYKKLYLLICGLVAGLKTLLWVALLMAITIYMFAIFSVQTIGHSPTFGADVWEEKYPDSEFSSEKYFKNIFLSMLTMWECLNDGCTTDVVRPVITENWYYMPIFLAFVFLMVYGFLNILVGVFVDAITETATEQEEMIQREEELASGSWEHHVRDLWKCVNTDDDGGISKKEFFDAFEREELRTILTTLNLANVEAGELFNTIDVNGSGSIWKEELIEGVMKFRAALKNPEVSTLMIKKRTEAEFSRCMEVLNKVGTLLVDRKMIDSYTEFKKSEDGEVAHLAEAEKDENEEEAEESGPGSPVKSPRVKKFVKRIDSALVGKWNLRFATPELEEPYLQSLAPQTLTCLKVSIAVQAQETISRALTDESDVSPGANSLRAAFSAFCCLCTALIAFVLRKSLKDETPWPWRWTLQQVLTALFMVKLIGAALLRPCRLAAAVGLETAEISCTPDLYWELVLLLYTVLGTWLPSRFQNQLLVTQLSARVAMLVILDVGLLGMGVDALNYCAQEFFPISVLSGILAVCCYVFDMERRRSFMMKHLYMKYHQEVIQKSKSKSVIETPKAPLPPTESKEKKTEKKPSKGEEEKEPAEDEPADEPAEK
eukprot:gnl/MRDRNA2_/MRDRNA2_88348_c0_seq1.p1 gnl/MRDRNA2_/MRDRNA2_88348_c0~~gnl/MRDRNA2_/MRDRNA2_88348_c0_seq1.p1  ORF type:complete len:827 (+),score=184.88 gnl/MRDRNA2_/MRDRNA2_88348_c0_seq1:70-2550(+)